MYLKTSVFCFIKVLPGTHAPDQITTVNLRFNKQIESIVFYIMKGNVKTNTMTYLKTFICYLKYKLH